MEIILTRVGIRSNGYPTSGRVVVDEVGLGAGLLDRLSELGYRAGDSTAGGAPKNGDRFTNLRAESYWRLRERLETYEIALPPHEELTEGLLATSCKVTAEGKVAIPPRRN